MKSLFYSLVLFALIVACGTPKSEIKQETKSIAVLTDSTFYLPFKVKAYALENKQNSKIAKNFYYKGIDVFKNRQDLDSGEFYFKSAIYRYPTAPAYYELGNVLKEKRKYEEALSAYQVAEQLGYDPVGTLFLQQSRVYALMEKDNEAGDYLTIAMQAGFTNFDAIKNHPDYYKFKDSWSYRYALSKGMRGMSNPEELFWLQYKKEFPKVKLPLLLQNDFAEGDWQTMKFISYDFEKYVPDMRDEKFSRGVGVAFYFYATVYDTEDFVAVVYVSMDEFYDEEVDIAPYQYTLMTYSKEGKIIDRKMLAGQVELDGEWSTANISPGGRIERKVYSVQYEKDTNKNGFLNNKLLSKTLQREEFFEISQLGKITVSTSEISSLN